MTGDALDIAPPRIFVAIAAYRDPELQWTLRDLFERARHPDRIEVGGRDERHIEVNEQVVQAGRCQVVTQSFE